MAKASQTTFPKRDLAYATNLIRQVCEIAGQRNLIADTRASFREIGLLDAMRSNDNDALFDWLAEAISYQGIADNVAAGYIEQHGTVGASVIEAGLGDARCPKLTSFWHFEGCGYRKGLHTCNQPQHIKRCPLPKHDLRNGQLNQAAYSLHLFMRDVAGGDLIGWIDRQLAHADDPLSTNRVERLCDAILTPLRNIHGVSDKVLNMTMANLLLAGDPARERWGTAGAGMVAIDTLVHNWLHRTGILRHLKAKHVYGPQCYGPHGCFAIINASARLIDARKFNTDFPKCFPRFIQKAIWSFSAANGFDRCNGNRINDVKRCGDGNCPMYASCARVALSTRRTQFIKAS